MDKIKIIDVFNEIINQVDIDAETILLRVASNDDLRKSIGEDISQSRKLLIDKIIDIKNENLDNLNKTANSSERRYEDLFLKHCVYLDSDTVRSFTFKKYRLGILIVTDFYIAESQAKLLKNMGSSLFRIDLINEKGKENLVIDHSSMENLFILSQLKSQIFSDNCIIEFDSKLFDEITEISLECCILIANRLDKVFKRFCALKKLVLTHMNIQNINIHNIDDAINQDTFGIPSLEELVLNNCIVKKESYFFRSLKNLKVLELSYNDIILDSQLFHNLNNLEKLDLSHNSIKTLPDNIFFQLSNLKYLNLSRNPIEIIKKATLNGLDKLEHFCLEGIGELFLDGDTFEGLDNLRKVEIGLGVNSNHVEVNPPKFLEETVLILEDLDSGFLKWINSANNLKRFSLPCLNFKTKDIDESLLSNCNALEEFKLSKINLNLDVFPRNLNNLKRIKLEEVSFLKDPENLFSDLENIEDIEISDCKFQNDSHKHRLFENLKNLKKLCFNNSIYQPRKITSILFVSMDLVGKNNPDLIGLDLSYNTNVLFDFDGFNKVNSLETINLSCNAIHHLNDKFSRLVYLKQLNLSENKLKVISNESFSSLVNLEKLNLRNNQINRVEENSFKGLTNLKHLILSSNCLRELDDELFKDLINLIEIDLSHNRIKNIDNLFDNNLKLNYLDLSNNRIRSIKFILLAKLVNLDYLSLQYNQIENINAIEFNYFMCCTSNNLRLDLEDDLGSYFMNLSNPLKLVSFK